MVTRKIFSHSVLFGLCLLGEVMQAQAVNGIYLWVEGGWAQQNNLPSPEQVMAQNLHSDLPIGLRASVGYNHDFFSHFGVGLEVAAGHYGDSVYEFTQQSDVHITTNTVEFLGALNFHWNQWDFFSKLGGVRESPDISGPSSAESHTLVDPEWIVGTAYNFTGPTYWSHFAVSLDYMTIIKNLNGDLNIQDPTNNVWRASTTINAVLVGLRYNFGPNL
jgi:hypothetical protein